MKVRKTHTNKQQPPQSTLVGCHTLSLFFTHAPFSSKLNIMSPLGNNLNINSTSKNSSTRDPPGRNRRNIWVNNVSPNTNYSNVRKSTLKSNFGFDQFCMKIGHNFVHESCLTDGNEQGQSLARRISISTDSAETDDGAKSRYHCKGASYDSNTKGSEKNYSLSTLATVGKSPILGQYANQSSSYAQKSFSESLPQPFANYQLLEGENIGSPEVLSDGSNSSTSLGSGEFLVENCENAQQGVSRPCQNTPYVFIDEVEMGTFSAGRSFKSAFHAGNGHGGYRHTSAGTKRKRMRMTPEQLRVLQKAFAHNRMPTANFRAVLAKRLGMTSRSVQIWFQNRRAKVKQNSKEETPNSTRESSPAEMAEEAGSSVWQSFCPSFSSDHNEGDGGEHAAHSLPLTPRPSSEGFPLYGKHNAIGNLLKIATESDEPLVGRNSEGLMSAANSDVVDVLTPFPNDSQLYFGSDSIYSEQPCLTGPKGLLYFQNDQLALPMVRQQSPFMMLGRSASFCNVNNETNHMNFPAIPLVTEIPEWQVPNISTPKVEEHGNDVIHFGDSFGFLYPDPLNLCPSALDCIEDVTNLRHDSELARSNLFDLQFNYSRKQRSFSTSDIFGSFNNGPSTGYSAKPSILM